MTLTKWETNNVDLWVKELLAGEGIEIFPPVAYDPDLSTDFSVSTSDW